MPSFTTRALLVALLWLAAVRSASALTVIQDSGGMFGGGNTVSCSMTVTAGNVLTVMMVYLGTGMTVSSVTGTINGALTQASAGTGTYAGAAAYYKTGITGGAETITVTLSSGSAYGTARCAEIGPGTVVTAPAPNEQNGPGGGTDAITSGTSTTGVNSALCQAATMETNFDSAAIAMGTGWTNANSGNDQGSSYGMAQQTQSTAGSIAGTFTAPGGHGADIFYSILLCIQPAAGTSVRRRMMLLGVN